MSLQFGTVKSISAPRIRKPQPARPPLTTEQREDKLRAHKEREARINAKVQEWVSYTLNLAEELGNEFEKKPRYFLDLFFQSGARLVRSKTKVNAFNAFKSLKAEEINTGGLMYSLDVLAMTNSDHRFDSWQCNGSDGNPKGLSCGV